MSILSIRNLSHCYDDKVLFRGAEVSINNGEHVGVVGLNGAGKTTFINILAGEVLQDEGEVRWLGGLSRAYLDQHADIEGGLTVIDYLYSSKRELFGLSERMERLYSDMAEETDEQTLEIMIQKANSIMERLQREGFFELETRIKKTAAGLGVDKFGYDTMIGELSGGQRAKLMLVKLLLEAPDVMLLDEPTNFLDIEHIDWLSEYLCNVKQTYLVISHDTEFLDKVCKVIISIENGTIKKYGGNYSQFLKQREQNQRQYEDSYNRQQREIERLEEYISRNSARAATAGMANARKKRLDKLELIEKPAVIYDADFSFPCQPLHTRELVVAKDLSIGYNNTPLLPPINFSLSGETKLWIRGMNGIGKTTLLKTLMGIIPAVGGKFCFHPQSKICYLEQDPEFRNYEITPAAYYNDLFPKLSVKEIRVRLAKAGIKNELAVKMISDMSGGEQVRTRLAVLTSMTSNILILDEPTNHLDIRAKESLKEALAAYNGAIILVSHERPFAEAVANDIFDIKL